MLSVFYLPMLRHRRTILDYAPMRVLHYCVDIGRFPFVGRSDADMHLLSISPEQRVHYHIDLAGGIL